MFSDLWKPALALVAAGYLWNTSLTRTDTGAGACELFYVESIERR